MAALQLLKTVKNAAGVVVAKIFQDPSSKTKVAQLINVRASFIFVGTPGEDDAEPGQEKKKSWRCVAMLPKNTHTEAKDAVKELLKELMVTNDVKVPSTEWCTADGDGEKYEDDKYKSFHGHWLVSIKDGQHRPRSYDPKGQVMDDIAEIDKMFYGGCWINVTLRPWFFTGKVKGSAKTFPKRLLAGFVSLQKHHDDTPFGTGRIDDSGIYEAVDEGSGGGNGMDDDVDGL